MTSQIYRIQRHGGRGEAKTFARLAGNIRGRNQRVSTRAVNLGLGPAKGGLPWLKKNYRGTEGGI